MDIRLREAFFLVCYGAYSCFLRLLCLSPISLDLSMLCLIFFLSWLFSSSVMIDLSLFLWHSSSIWLLGLIFFFPSCWIFQLRLILLWLIDLCFFGVSAQFVYYDWFSSFLHTGFFILLIWGIFNSHFLPILGDFMRYLVRILINFIIHGSLVIMTWLYSSFLYFLCVFWLLLAILNLGHF